MSTLLRLGDTGILVRQLQRMLNDLGASIIGYERLLEDGWFGVTTQTALVAAQRRFGSVADGIAGPKTFETLQLRTKPAKLLGDHHLINAAERLGVEIAAIRAVVEVESRGQGFLEDGRPVILFERHIMYRQLKASGLDADALAEQYPTVVSPKRGGYLGGAAEHARLAHASQIDRGCAIESASWGLFQVMGFHWKPLGYVNPAEFAALMCRSEGDHLDAFIRFIEAEPSLHKALKSRKWERFAAGYNGPAYKSNLYDVKLARAYDRYADPESATA